MSVTNSPVGLTMDDRIMGMPKGWIVVYRDGTTVTEEELDWSQVKRNNIKKLALKWHTKFWTISGKSAYFQFKRGWVPFLTEAEIQCEERCIGFYEPDGSKVVYRVNEKTGQMRMEVLDLPNGNRG